jgi:hypothetical protein
MQQRLVVSETQRPEVEINVLCRPSAVCNLRHTSAFAANQFFGAVSRRIELPAALRAVPDPSYDAMTPAIDEHLAHRVTVRPIVRHTIVWRCRECAVGQTSDKSRTKAAGVPTMITTMVAAMKRTSVSGRYRSKRRSCERHSRKRSYCDPLQRWAHCDALFLIRIIRMRNAPNSQMFRRLRTCNENDVSYLILTPAWRLHSKRQALGNAEGDENWTSSNNKRDVCIIAERLFTFGRGDFIGNERTRAADTLTQLDRPLFCRRDTRKDLPDPDRSTIKRT